MDLYSFSFAIPESHIQYLIVLEDKDYFYFSVKNRMYSYSKRPMQDYRVTEYPVLKLVNCVYYEDQFIMILPEGQLTFDTLELQKLGYEYMDIDCINIKQEFIKA